jgi:hypothetical protein
MNFEQLLAQLRAGGTLNLDQLRFLCGELNTRAAAMPATITAETPPADAERIEREHQAMLADLDRARGLVTEAERAAAAPSTPASEEVRAAIAADRQRVGAIQGLAGDCQRYGIADDFLQRHITEGTSFDNVRLALFDQIRARSDQNPTFSHVQVMRDETDTRRQGAEAAIVARLAQAGGERNVQVPEHARQYMGMGLPEIAAECIGFRGPLRTGRQVDDMLTRAMHTTSDFPGIFTNALNVRLLARYVAAQPTYRLWAARYDANDFRPQPVVRAGDFPSLERVNETGEIKSGSFSESKEQQQVYAYGIMLRISRQMMVNDNLNAIEQVLGSAGVRVADWENVQMYTLLGNNPALLTDSVAVFHATHANLASPGTAISVASIGTGRAAMMKQTTLDGIKANFTPTRLIVGPDKLTEAEQLLATIIPAQQSNAVPDSIRKLVPAGDANISGNSWYLFADPAAAPCFVYGYLNGAEGPRLTSEEGFDTQGMKVKLEHDFGAAAIDHRGAYRNPGA